MFIFGNNHNQIDKNWPCLKILWWKQGYPVFLPGFSCLFTSLAVCDIVKKFIWQIIISDKKCFARIEKLPSKMAETRECYCFPILVLRVHLFYVVGKVFKMVTRQSLNNAIALHKGLYWKLHTTWFYSTYTLFCFWVCFHDVKGILLGHI